MKRFVIIILAIACSLQIAWAQGTYFRFNQVGYLPGESKRALLISSQPVSRPVLIKGSGDKREVMRVVLDKHLANAWALFPYTYEINFSGLSTLGKYYFELEGSALKSQSFNIGPYPQYQDEILGFMRSQRCGYNPYIEQACHGLDGRTFFGPMADSTYINAAGGWHDAGDQLKYLITTSNAVARMLLAYKWAPEKFASDKVNGLGKNESNQIPDVLDEARWGLDWIHRLHPAPDQLFHQIADDRDHRGFKLPNEDNADYGWGKNSYRPVYFANGKPQGAGKYLSEATGVANIAGRSSAAMAIASQIWKENLKDQVYANQCLKAAIELYDMGKKQEGYQQGNSYGAPYRYMEDTWADDMEWAAAELYKATKKQNYLDDAIKYAMLINTHSWMEMDTASHYQMYPYNNIGHYSLWEIGDQKTRKIVSSYYEHNLNVIKKKASKNSYNVGHLFIWCSNNLAASVITQVILYEKMTGNKQFHQLMLSHRDWLLGCNPWGTSMITGIPEKGDYPLDVHMPFWRIQRKVIPGSLVDGPLWESIHSKMIEIKSSEPDEYATFQPPHVKYLDDWADYSTNEPTMDGSADIIYLMAFFSKVK